MFHLFSGLQTAVLFSICSANSRLKIDEMKPSELYNLNSAIMLKNVTGIRWQKVPEAFIHSQLNNKDDNNNLDSRSMARRYGNPFSNYKSVPYSNYESVPFSNYRSVPFRSVQSQRTNSFETRELREAEDHQIIDVLFKQTILMEKLAAVLEMEQNSLRSKNDFEDLLTEMDLSKVKKKSKKTTTTSTTVQVKKKMSTIMTVVDETDVRKALKRDPLVKRILKMANRRRTKYIQAAKKYFKA